MSTYTTKLLRVGGIAGMLYRGKDKTGTLVVYGLGAPVVPDNGTMPDASVIMKYKVDLFIPDYIGYGRSDGEFTPGNCIKTFLELYEKFKRGCTAKNYYEKSTIRLKYKGILFIGRSFGGTYLPLLPRFNKDIQDLCLIYPAIHNKVYGSRTPEESNRDFIRMMRKDGYHHLYRGILSREWEKHLAEKDDLSPMDIRNIRYLKNLRIFIGHGTEDKVLHYSRTVDYYKKLLETFPERQDAIKLKLYKGTGHTSETSYKIVRDYLNWLIIPKVNR